MSGNWSISEDVKDPVIHQYLSSLKRAGSNLIYEPNAKRQQSIPYWCSNNYTQQMEKQLPLLDKEIFNFSTSQTDREFPPDQIFFEPHPNKMTYMKDAQLSDGDMMNKCSVDEDVEQLLFNLPTSVDDFQFKELSLKQGKSPLISQRTSPNFNRVEDFSIPYDIGNMQTTISCQYDNDTGYDDEPDEDDLEVARINESFELEQKQSLLFHSQNLRSLFYNGENENYSADFVNGSKHKQLFTKPIIQGVGFSLSVRETETFEESSRYIFKGETPVQKIWPEHEESQQEFIDDPHEYPSYMEESAQKLVHEIVESLLSSPELLASETTIDEDCILMKSIKPLYGAESACAEYPLSDSMLMKIQEELINLMGDDENIDELSDNKSSYSNIYCNNKKEESESERQYSYTPTLTEEQFVSACQSSDESIHAASTIIDTTSELIQRSTARNEIKQKTQLDSNNGTSESEFGSTESY